MKLISNSLFLCFLTLGFSQQKVLELWPEGVPNSIENMSYIESYTYDDSKEIRGIAKVSNPTLTAFLVDSTTASDGAIIICPGGGYSDLAIKKEGYKIAEWLNILGMSAFVLKYRIPSDETMTNKTIGPLQDAQKAIRMVRKNANTWNINPNKIGILGFSAGGHLASSASTHYNEKVYANDTTISARPDFSVLVYPVISMADGVTHQGSKKNLLQANPSEEHIKKYSNALQVTTETPPTFLVHATDDTAVPVENSIEYYLALKANKVAAEMHIYEDGGHGFGLGRNGTNAHWPEDLKRWFLANQILSK